MLYIFSMHVPFEIQKDISLCMNFIIKRSQL
jgi:hypothetical protein